LRDLGFDIGGIIFRVKPETSNDMDFLK